MCAEMGRSRVEGLWVAAVAGFRNPLMLRSIFKAPYRALEKPSFLEPLQFTLNPKP